MSPHSSNESRRIALVHDWLIDYGGGERCVTEFLDLYPDAELFTLIDKFGPSERAMIGGRHAHTSVLQVLPNVRRYYRKLLPLMPFAVEHLRVRKFGVVLSSSHAVAKGVRTNREQVHVCYCYSPMRYAWDFEELYLQNAGLAGGLRGKIVRYLLARLRRWDRKSSTRVDQFIAISQYVADRIKRVYDRDSVIVYPPVNTELFFRGAETRGGQYITASRLVVQKRVDIIVRAFAEHPDRELFVIGDGPERKRLEEIAPPNVRFLGRLSDSQLRTELAQARAFLFAAEEEFGIAPLEAQACGTPVIAFGRGGATETIRGLDSPVPTGVFFEEQTASSVAQAIARFEANSDRISSSACRANAERFSPDEFKRQIAAVVNTALAARGRAPLSASPKVS